MSMSDIVVTATGMITAAGTGADRAWEAMARGESFFVNRTPAERGPDVIPWPVAQVRLGDLAWPPGAPWVDNHKYANTNAHAAVAVARLALERCGRATADDGPRAGTVMAISTTTKDELSDVMPKLALRSRDDPRPLVKLLYDEVPDYSYIRGIPSQLGQFTAMASGFTGSNVVVYGESGASGFGALSLALRMLDSGEQDRMMVVGVAPPLALGALATFDREEPFGVEAGPGSGPFDIDRAGTLLGQGAVAIVLERDHVARARGVTPLARLAACTAMSATDRRAALGAALDTVLAGAARPPGVWWAHGAGSPGSDRDEYDVVGARLGAVTTASKGTIGNAFECGGLFDVALAVETLHRRVVPPVGLLERPDPAMRDLDLVVGAPREVPALHTALVTTFGLGNQAPSAGAALLTRE
jgi:3-oxoacyl-[acyl-carrier-protein] synthase II